MNPRVTIGFVVKNGADSIERGLESLLAQSFTDFEILISDNQSTDNTAEICKRVAAMDSRVKYICQLEDIGAVSNFWYVLEEAKTEYFMWAAHDDYWESDFLAKLVSALDASYDFGLAVSWVNVFDPLTGESRYSFKPKPTSSNSGMIRYLAEHLAPCVNKIYGLHRTENLKSFDHETFKVFDYLDTLIIDHVNLSTKIEVVPEYLFNYAEEPQKVRNSLDPSRQKVEGIFAKLNKFDHLRYVSNSLKLMRSFASNVVVKVSVSLAFCAIFLGMKLHHRVGRGQTLQGRTNQR